MKAITIKQPFASLITAGLKEYEFRTWKAAYRGELLIHAGKSVDAEAMKRFAGYGLTFPVGCIIAKATLTECVRVTEDFREELRQKMGRFTREPRKRRTGKAMDSGWRMCSG